MPDEDSHPISVARIAALLTHEERKALRWLNEDGSDKREDVYSDRPALLRLRPKTIAPFVEARLAVCHQGTRAGLRDGPYLWHLTELGMDVRRALFGGSGQDQPPSVDEKGGK